ncbi:zinc metalloprotease [Crepidotus variabilis]|uniref:Disintegrin and metalloproteinase domain-containing protein B n=1 Tax=Crepidotus variabilis TaxID=179855 RepID=A0A9P6EH13_9AGAR|nr:zinc metalloprotease [Crepidotus variabilis]
MTILISLFALAVTLVSTCSQLSLAHSTSSRPLKRVAHPSTRSLEILPRIPVEYSSFPAPLYANKRPHSSPPASSLRYDDFFRLILSAYDETFHLHLRPNDHLIHPSARIDHYTLTDEGREVLAYSEPLIRADVKAYLGEVIAPYHSETRMREDAARMYPQTHPAVLGWARILVHHQGDHDSVEAPVFEGAFSVKGEIYHIMTKDNYFRNKHDLDPSLPEATQIHQLDRNLVIWRDSDEMSLVEEHMLKTGVKPSGPLSEPMSCGHDRLDFNQPSQNPMMMDRLHPQHNWLEGLINPVLDDPFYSRDDAPIGGTGMDTDFRDTIGSTVGCPTTQKVVYTGVAADCTYVTKYGSKENATTQILTNWNSASALYKSTFNISLAIAEINIREPVCPTTADPTLPWNVPCASAELDDRLSAFSSWRGNKGEDGNGLWHLMSGCPTGSEVGIAWLGTLCQSRATGNAPTIVSGAAVSTAGKTEWQVVAHETGHNFGAIHDCAGNCSTTTPCCPLSASVCPADGKFIMSPVAQAGEKTFSPCSIGNICSVMKGVSGGRVDTSCLLDPDPTRQSVSLQMCGNGIVEKGEDCDPGKGSDSKCCDVNTCKFKNNAKCDPDSSPCCTDQCNFAAATQVCRPSKDQSCDTAELCTGNSSSCPIDIVAPNGKSCGGDSLACASGICTSVAQQCKTVGASLNLTQACPDKSDQSCQISCLDPNPGRPNSCVQLTSLLVDGSPCGFGGTCLAGKCQAAGLLDTAKAWYTSNLQISIPVTVVAGLVALFMLYALIRALRRCCGARTRDRSTPITGVIVADRPPSHERLMSYDGRYAHNVIGSSTSYTRAPPATYGSSPGETRDLRYNYEANNRMDWVDESNYNGPRRY